MTPREESNLRASGGPMSGRSIIGETTEALHRFLLDGYNLGENPPRLEEELKFIPKDREEVLYFVRAMNRYSDSFCIDSTANLQKRKVLPSSGC